MYVCIRLSLVCDGRYLSSFMLCKVMGCFSRRLCARHERFESSNIRQPGNETRQDNPLSGYLSHSGPGTVSLLSSSHQIASHGKVSEETLLPFEAGNRESGGISLDDDVF